MLTSPKVLFVPVSSAEGIGEYMRSIIFAEAIKARWPDAEIHFMLSNQAPYASQCPFPCTLLNQSPTKEVKAVNHFMEQFMPDLVIFDASGRQSQLQKAHSLGAKVVFISQHKRKRSRGMKIGRARVTDSHWVVQPEFVIGPVSSLDCCKLKLLKKPLPLNIGPVFTAPDRVEQNKLLKKYQLQQDKFVLFNAGSGGHKIGQQLAADIFASVATEGAANSGVMSVMVFGPNYPKPLPQLEGVICISSISNADFINLLTLAQGAVISGGDTLLQSIALHVATLAVPVSKDQPARIKVCFDQGLILSCATEKEAMIEQYQSLLSQVTRDKLVSAMLRNPTMDGLALGLCEIERLLRDH
ncbi:hypothetical protein [Shewanella sp. NIFS-20-20]|uniref:hypothetical protein n=1 Tax=Shewanella sp. NIFS-20-20 TaxID=2853806 RepID=UPI001C44824D|nr:hypothetical protein [Shewanella sp. NIFS-20-20]MBV7316121.1 hypothetical protein [Shewanella sp. NIFS-20-20]